MELIYLYFVLALLVAIMAAIRGRVGWRWFIIALFLSPLISGILVMALPRQDALSSPDAGEAGLQVVPMPMDSTIRIIAPPAAAGRRLPIEIYVNGVRVGLVHQGGITDFPVPSGRLLIEAGDQWALSRPVAIKTEPNQRVDLEISRDNSGPLLALWSMFARDPGLALRRMPAPPAVSHAA